ncbi:MAG: hypothetical protein IKK97_02305 [Phascolarctobacterium sp.]|nr:hypothetical protein [Phascolarctobacterium sp.]
MLGTKLYKGQFTNKEYADLAVWCNANNATIEDKGEYYECVAIPAPSLDELKQAKLNEVDKWTANKITGGFVSTCYNGENVLYDTDTETQLTMTKARANCEGERFAQAFPNGMGVRGYAQTGTDADGTMVFANTKTIYNFLPEHIIAWDEDFSLHLAKCKYEGWIKQAQVNACTTKEELEAIVLE